MRKFEVLLEVETFATGFLSWLQQIVALQRQNIPLVRVRTIPLVWKTRAGERHRHFLGLFWSKNFPRALLKCSNSEISLSCWFRTYDSRTFAFIQPRSDPSKRDPADGWVTALQDLATQDHRASISRSFWFLYRLLNRTFGFLFYFGIASRVCTVKG